MQQQLPDIKDIEIMTLVEMLERNAEHTPEKAAIIYHIEAAGAAPVTIPEMEKSMSVNSKIIYLGRAATSTPMYLDALVSGANKIIGSRGHSGHGIFSSIIKLIASGRLSPQKMITIRYPFKNVLDALMASTKRTNGKIIVRV
jgi:threonine dehydrogenase-like Zn-dependent dehydrogenase